MAIPNASLPNCGGQTPNFLSGISGASISAAGSASYDNGVTFGNPLGNGAILNYSMSVGGTTTFVRLPEVDNNDKHFSLQKQFSCCDVWCPQFSLGGDGFPVSAPGTFVGNGYFNGHGSIVDNGTNFYAVNFGIAATQIITVGAVKTCQVKFVVSANGLNSYLPFFMQGTTDWLNEGDIAGSHSFSFSLPYSQGATYFGPTPETTFDGSLTLTFF